MTAILFAGPTLAGAEAEMPEGFHLSPPARQGDIFRASQTSPEAIGLVDGYFEGVPSVWHKEILWALSLGIRVFGSGSMGALRAAELRAFGMIGVGRVYEDYRDGRLEADDEVALLHGPQEISFVGLTEPLVNVRATCRAAEGAGIVESAEADAILAAAGALFYKVRVWRLILDRASELGLSPEAAERFADFLPEGRVDQKRQDALEMIAAMQAFPAEERHPSPEFHFESTFLWERAVAGWQSSAARNHTGASSPRRLRPRETLAGLVIDDD